MKILFYATLFAVLAAASRAFSMELPTWQWAITCGLFAWGQSFFNDMARHIGEREFAWRLRSPFVRVLRQGASEAREQVENAYPQETQTK